MYLCQHSSKQSIKFLPIQWIIIVLVFHDGFLWLLVRLSITFKCLLSTCTVSVNFLFIFFVPFVSRLFAFFLLICKNYLFIREGLHLSVMNCKYFLPVCDIFQVYPSEILHFYAIQSVNFSPLCLPDFMFFLEKYLSMSMTFSIISLRFFC